MQSHYQINGTAVQESIDTKHYSTSADVLQGVMVISEQYGLVGKIDLLYIEEVIIISAVEDNPRPRKVELGIIGNPSP